MATVQNLDAPTNTRNVYGPQQNIKGFTVKMDLARPPITQLDDTERARIEKWMGDTGTIAIPVSARTGETHAFNVTVARHAVESGVVFTDHAIEQPREFTAEFTITNFDMSDTKLAYAMLESLMRMRMPMTIITQHGIIPDMVMVRLTMDNQLPAWDALECTANFQQVNFVALKGVTTAASTPAVRTDQQVGGELALAVQSQKTKGNVQPLTSPSILAGKLQ